MTGWRIGWLVLPEDLVRPVECLAQNLFISAPHISQIAAEAAFDCHDELQANVARYRRSRDHLLRGAAGGRLRAAVARPRARSTCYADIADRSNDSVAFCARMLAEAGVAATPGVDFDRDARRPASCASAIAARRRTCGKRPTASPPGADMSAALVPLAARSRGVAIAACLLGSRLGDHPDTPADRT